MLELYIRLVTGDALQLLMRYLSVRLRGYRSIWRRRTVGCVSGSCDTLCSQCSILVRISRCFRLRPTISDSRSDPTISEDKSLGDSSGGFPIGGDPLINLLTG